MDEQLGEVGGPVDQFDVELGKRAQHLGHRLLPRGIEEVRDRRAATLEVADQPAVGGIDVRSLDRDVGQDFLGRGAARQRHFHPAGDPGRVVLGRVDRARAVLAEEQQTDVAGRIDAAGDRLAGGVDDGPAAAAAGDVEGRRNLPAAVDQPVAPVPFGRRRRDLARLVGLEIDLVQRRVAVLHVALGTGQLERDAGRRTRSPGRPPRGCRTGRGWCGRSRWCYRTRSAACCRQAGRSARPTARTCRR